MSSPSSSVQEARRALGRRLREIRKDAGLAGRELACQADWHESKTSRLEHGKTPPSDADIRLWARLCGVTGQVPDLIATAQGIVGRGEFRGHVTAGALLLRPDGRVLLVEHKALGKWLFPGGHLEDEDETLMRAALRELAEETGIAPGLVTPVSPVPLHIDIHPIPANPAKSEPDHQHFDFRFLFRTDADVAALQTKRSWTTPGSTPTPTQPSPSAPAWQRS